MIPIGINNNGYIVKNKDSTQYIAVSEERHESFLSKLKQGNFSYSLEAIYYCDINKFQTYTEEVFNSIATEAEKNYTKDYGVEDGFTYAYIMAHTEPEEHKFLRFYRWDKNERSQGFIDLGKDWRKILQLPKEIKTNATEYYRIPTCIGDLTDDKNIEWHIFATIYKISNQKTQLIIYHDNLNTDRKNNFPKDITIKELSVGKAYYLRTTTNNPTACAFATVEFFKKTNEEIEKFDINLKNKLENNLYKIQINAQNQIKNNSLSHTKIKNTNRGAKGLKLNWIKQKQTISNSKIITNLKCSFSQKNKTTKALQGYQENYIKNCKNNIKYK